MDHNDKLLISLLNLSYDSVESIHSTSDDSNHLSIFVTLARRNMNCPFCGNVKLLSNGFYRRKISIPHRAFENVSVCLKVPRYKCSCGHSFSDSYAMAPACSKVSYDMISTVMELLKDPRMTFSAVAAQTRLSETTVSRIFDRHCVIPRIPFPEVICVDEVYTRVNAYDAKYSCIFYDFYNQTIVDVLPDRKKGYLHKYFQSLQGSNELLNVKYVCMDMYLPYKQISKFYFKKALICVDSFHLIKHLNESLQKVRIRVLRSYDTDSIQYYLLKKWKCLLFDRTIDLDNKGKYNKRLGRYVNYRQLLELILAIHPDLKKAYELKERYTIFNATSFYDEARSNFDDIYRSFVNAHIPEYCEFITSLSNWRDEIINSFIVYRGKRINSSVAESMNAIVSTLLFNTKGIKNVERRRKRIIYAVNKTGFLIK